MGVETLKWAKVVHLFGMVMWMGTMMGLIQLFLTHSKADGSARGPLIDLEKAMAMAMDVGATLSIVTGVLLIVGPPGGTAIFKAGGFFHIKLTLVAALIGLHGYLRVKVRKFREGQVGGVPAWLPGVWSLAVVAVIVMIVVRPFAK